MSAHPIIWTQPAPFWGEATAGVAPRGEFTQPAILRFANDDFMDELLGVLATDPRRLGEYRARPETWRGAVPAPAQEQPRKTFARALQRLGNARRNMRSGALPGTPPESTAPAAALKLYQPAHQRYYVVTSCLVCQTPGLPDRRVEPAREERVSFLLRRLFPPAAGAARPIEEWEEHAWVSAPLGSFWRRLTAPESVAENEERLPMFALQFSGDDLRQRRLFAGLIPVGKREAYLGGARGTGAAPPGVSVKTARKILFRKEVAEPWKSLLARAASVAAQLSPTAAPPSSDRPPTAAERDARFDEERAQLQTISWLVLLDFARFLQQYLPGIHEAIHGFTPSEPLTTAQSGLLAALGQIKVGAALATAVTARSPRKTVASSLADALKRVASFETALESTETAYIHTQASAGWPDFLFPLADPQVPTEAPLPPATLLNLTPSETADLAETADPADNDPTPERIDHLTVLVVRALPAAPPSAEPAVPAAAVAAEDALDGRFILRCLYERPACGPLHDDVLSARSEPFQLASFFDPDAPARPIRIGLPLDISPAGLRKFDRNTAFVMSDMLCGQIKRLRGLTLGDLVRSVLPWPLHKDLSVPDGGPCKSGAGLNIGTVCSLSIPIITICALLLLMIIVSLLDIVFRWLPYFILCFPVPGLRAKKS